MTTPGWQLSTPVSAIVFDCDGTLTSIEGIDFLAKNNGVGDKVRSLTSETIEKTGLNPSLYQKRLELVLPRREQIYALAHQYFSHKASNVCDVINVLRRLNKMVYLVSAGMNPAVKIFGEMLQIPAENIFAVDLRFDQQGNFLHFDETSPLIHNDGKRVIIQALKAKHNHIVYVGDGLNDIAAHDLVTRFIGYGGVSYRKNIADLCQYFINTGFFTALLPLMLTPEESLQLEKDEQAIFQNGLTAIEQGKVQVPHVDIQKNVPPLEQSLHLAAKGNNL